MRSRTYGLRMRAPALVVAALLAAMPAVARADRADVVIQAGHQGRPDSCAPHHVKACNLGAAAGMRRERDWTPVVADAAAAVVRRAGLSVIRRPADYEQHDVARAAVFVHFDGSRPCASGASVGYPATTDRAFVHRWATRYRRYFPFRFVGENFTANEARYYGYRKVDAPGRSMLVEFGELTCPVQADWMEPRLRALGETLGRFLVEELE